MGIVDKNYLFIPDPSRFPDVGSKFGPAGAAAFRHGKRIFNDGWVVPEPPIDAIQVSYHRELVTERHT